jgi:hypothetical protein
MRALLGFSSIAVLHMRTCAAWLGGALLHADFPFALEPVVPSFVHLGVDLGTVMLHSGGRILYAYAAARTC